jgi:hypothetical protein
MKKSISKFDDIAFPFFGLKSKPYKVVYDINKISVIRHKDSHAETADDKRLPGDYFSRLVQLEHRLNFDFTCKSIQDIIINKINWGLDSKAKPFDLSSKEMAITKIAKVQKAKDNLIWVDSIAYPFKLFTRETINLSEVVYVTLVYVKYEWFIKEFHEDKPKIYKAVYI